MSRLVQFSLRTRRFLRAGYGFAASLLPVAWLIQGHFSPGWSWDAWLLSSAFLMLVAWRALLRRRDIRRGHGTAIWDVELGWYLLLAIHIGLQGLAAFGGPWHTLVYALLATSAVFAAAPAPSVLVVLALGLEVAVHLPNEKGELFTLIQRGAFILFFGVLHQLYTRLEVARVRQDSQRRQTENQRRMEAEARMFRMVAAPTSAAVSSAGNVDAAESDPTRALRASIQEVHQSLFHMLEFIKTTLHLHTCVLLFRSPDGSHLRIAEVATDSDLINPEPIPAGEGAVGAVATRGLVMNLEHLKPGFRGIRYYTAEVPVQAFLGVPVVENTELVGALCADRSTDTPFTSEDEEALKQAAGSLLRVIENERVFLQLERSKEEQAVLYRASQALGSAHGLNDVIERSLSAAKEITDHDFAAVVFHDAAAGKHTVQRAVGEDAERFLGLTFKDNSSLTSMAVKNRHFLPYRGHYDEQQQVLFTSRTRLRGMKSLLVLPLVIGQEALGVVALAARRERAFGDTSRATLQVLANHMAVALSHAKAVKRLEDMAITDGLTGCLNKRAFREELDRRMLSARRFGRPLSLLVTDIDHFKVVNDTYGHATGDRVLRMLGEMLQQVKRETDVVARFGGEEFCVLCEETDTAGAVLLAERIREELESRIIQTEIGKLSVTTSIGVATFPNDSSDAGGLFESADKALYKAKETGRNRVCTASHQRPGSQPVPANPQPQHRGRSATSYAKTGS